MVETGNGAASKPTTVGFDLSYLICNIAGYLKVIQIILSIIGLCFIQASGIYTNQPRAEFYSFVSGTALCVTTILLFFHMYRLTAKIPAPWLKIELGYTGLWTLFYLIAGLLTVGLVNGHYNEAGYVAFAALVAYGLEMLQKIVYLLLGKSDS